MKARDIDTNSFGGVKNPVIFDSKGKLYVNHMVGVTRLNGIQPPDPYLRADGKKGENKPPQSGPVGKATSKPVDLAAVSRIEVLWALPFKTVTRLRHVPTSDAWQRLGE